MAPSCPCINTINWVDLGGNDFLSYTCKKKMNGPPENLKKYKAKKLVKSNKLKIYIFCEIEFLAVLNIFIVQELIFYHF